MFVERRSRRRYPMQLEMRFTAGLRRRNPVQGAGEVVDISSKGVAFRTSSVLERGMSISASMNWPVALNGECALKISMEGEVLRISEGLAVMSVERYEFRTSGKVGAVSKSDVGVLSQQLGRMLGSAIPA